MMDGGWDADAMITMDATKIRMLTQRLPYASTGSFSLPPSELPYPPSSSSTNALNPSIYDLHPKPVIFPLQTAEIIETCRKSSRAYTFERCTSTTGICIAEIASRSATEVCVYPPGLNATPFAQVR